MYSYQHEAFVDLYAVYNDFVCMGAFSCRGLGLVPYFYPSVTCEGSMSCYGIYTFLDPLDLGSEYYVKKLECMAFESCYNSAMIGFPCLMFLLIVLEGG